MKLWKGNKAEERLLLATLCVATMLALVGCKDGADGAGSSAPAGAAADTNSVATNAPAPAATNAAAPTEPAATSSETAASTSTDGNAGSSGSP